MASSEETASYGLSVEMNFDGAGMGLLLRATTSLSRFEFNILPPIFNVTPPALASRIGGDLICKKRATHSKNLKPIVPATYRRSKVRRPGHVDKSYSTCAVTMNQDEMGDRHPVRNRSEFNPTDPERIA